MLAATIAMAIAPSVSSLAAASRGAISLLDPVSQTAYSDHVPFAWEFTPGSKVKTTSTVYFQATTDRYRWRTISSKVPIRSGGYLWDTTGWPEGSYFVRSIVHSTLILDEVGPIVVDRTDPMSRITKPSEGDVIIEDAAEVYTAVIVGTTTLEADAFDFGSGVDTVSWSLDGETIGAGTPFEYNFSLNPGKHVLRATVSDLAGNSSYHEVQLVAAPGPSLIASELPDDTDPPTLPEGVPPSDPPTLPEGVPPSDPPTVPEPPSDPPTVPEPPSDPPTAPEPPADPPTLPEPTVPDLP
jgi:hypothetical protein